MKNGSKYFENAMCSEKYQIVCLWFVYPSLPVYVCAQSIDNLNLSSLLLPQTQQNQP